MERTDKKRGQLIRRRWGTWLLVAAASVAFWLGVAAWQQKQLVQVAMMSPGWWWIIALGFLVLLIWQGCRGWRSLAFYDLRHVAVRPPYWWACLAGAAVSLFLASNVDAVSELFGPTSLDAQISMQAWGWKLLFAIVAVPLMVLAVSGIATLWPRHANGSAPPKRTGQREDGRGTRLEHRFIRMPCDYAA